MAEKIKMDFNMMDEMGQAFVDGAQALESVLGGVKNIAAMLDDDGLLGQAGEAFSSACTGPLSQSVTSLKRKLEELEDDVRMAVAEMMDADLTAMGHY